MFPGFGTVLNVTTVLVGSSLGLLLGHRLPARTRDTVTDALGLVTLMIGALSAGQVTSAVLSRVVGSNAPVLIVLGALLVGGIVGSLADIEARLAGLGDLLRRRLSGAHRSAPGTPVSSASSNASRASDVEARTRFIEGFLTASLVFCVGPLTILGSLSDGLGLGAQQLILKSVLDGFASLAFAASLGVGVMASVVAVAVIQGLLTAVGFLLGDFLSGAQLTAITATGGLLLVGVGLRLLQIKQVPVGNLLPALVVAPLLVSAVAAFR
jgi:uncharacterized membrane protein YqgA involved in biofilm formation